MKFENTFCSQCGREFGPGDHGFSHCKDHQAAFKFKQKGAHHETSIDPIRFGVDNRPNPLDYGPLPFRHEDAVMSRDQVKAAIDAMEEAYEYIILNVPPKTKGKVDAVMRLRNNAHNLFVDFANHNISRIHHECTDSHA
jgi:hypothetical protein